GLRLPNLSPLTDKPSTSLAPLSRSVTTPPQSGRKETVTTASAPVRDTSSRKSTALGLRPANSCPPMERQDRSSAYRLPSAGTPSSQAPPIVEPGRRTSSAKWPTPGHRRPSY